MNPAVLSGQTSYLITFMASFLIWFMLAGLFVLWFIDGRVKKEEALHALMAAFIAWGLTQMIKNLFPVTRPFEASELVPMTLTIPFDPSFPSGHAAAAFGLATSIWLHDKKLGFIFILSAFLVAWGRVAGNVHYMADVSAGAVIGVVTAYTVGKLHLYKLIK
jgi:undecaprenyl-diphosphatase